MLKKLMENKLLLIIIVWTIILLIAIVVKKLPNQKSKEEVDNSMTIEVEREPTGMEELTEEEQMTYELSDVVVGLDNGKTIITGKVTNNNEEAHEIIVNINTIVPKLPKWLFKALRVISIPLGLLKLLSDILLVKITNTVDVQIIKVVK